MNKEEAQKPAKTSLLWSITAPSLPGTSYIFGTMHVRNESLLAAAARVHPYISACEGYAGEMSLDPEAAAGLAVMPFLPRGTSIRDFMPPRQFVRLRKSLLRSTGIDLEYYQNLLPLTIHSLASARLLTETVPLSMDEQLWQYASGLGKTLSGVETPAEQLAVLQSIATTDQVKMLRQLGRHTPKFRKSTLHLAQLYSEGKLDLLYKSAKRGLGSMRKKLLYDRNVLMADRIAQLIAQNTTFVAIGAAHLSGYKGVLRLLRHKGFILNPV